MKTDGNQRFDLATLRRFASIAKPFFLSEERFRALTLLAVLVGLSIGVTKLNVWMSGIAGSYMNALAGKDSDQFYTSIAWFVLAVACATPVGVMYRYCEDRFALLWRGWLSNYYVQRYFAHRSYYRINLERSLDNPDQRMSDEIRAFAGTSISFMLIFMNAVVSIWAWTTVLWHVSSTLTLVSIAYAFAGSFGTMLIGRRLVSLNFAQQKKEADYRYRLVQARDNSESIALYRGESKECSQIQQRLQEAVRNQSALIGWYRNLGFFTRSYDYFKGLLPVLIVAPFLLDSRLDFGALTQASIAFAWVLDALSLIVSQFERLSAFAATIARLGALSEELDKGDRYCVWPRENPTWITMGTDDNLVIENLTVMTPNRQRILIKDLSLKLSEGQNLLITGSSGVGKSALFRAIAGLWTDGQGIIKHPELKDLVFIPQIPYMILGTLRQQLLYSVSEGSFADSELIATLEKVQLGELVTRVGGLDVEMDWVNVLSLGEQQRIAFARLLLARPVIAFLDEATTALDEENERILYSQLNNLPGSYVSIGHHKSQFAYHQLHLEILENGEWRLRDLPIA